MDTDEPDLRYTNVARRLYSVLLKLVADNALSSFVTWQAVAQAIGLSREEPETMFHAARALGRMIEDLKDVADKVRAQIESGTSDSVLERARDLSNLEAEMEPLRHALIVWGMNLSGKWSELRQQLPESALAPLRYWRKLIPEDEASLGSIDLQELRQAIRDTRRAVVADPNTSAAFKAILLDLLRLLDDAVTAYAYGGIASVQASLRAFAVAAYAARDEVQAPANRDSAIRIGALWHKVSQAMDVAVKVDAIARVYEVLEKGWQVLLPHLPK